MKRKHFILALVAMLLSFVPPAFAQNVAKVGNTEYATIAEAAAAAQAGSEIKLLADATVEGTLALPAGIKLTSNGHTINGSIFNLTNIANRIPILLKFTGTVRFDPGEVRLIIGVYTGH